MVSANRAAPSLRSPSIVFAATRTLDEPENLLHCSIMELAHKYAEFTHWVVSLCPAPDKFAHTYAGMGIWLLAAVTTRRPLNSWLPLFVIIAIEGANEFADYLAYGSWRWHDTIRDMAATWFWPAILFIALNLNRKLCSPSPITSESDVEGPVPPMACKPPVG